MEDTNKTYKKIHTYTYIQIKRGSASTLNQGIVKTMTRGVNIDKANFEGKDLTVRMEGVREGWRDVSHWNLCFGQLSHHHILSFLLIIFIVLYSMLITYPFPHTQGVSFQQSLMRAGNFRNSKCVSASFFDGDLSSTF